MTFHSAMKLNNQLTVTNHSYKTVQTDIGFSQSIFSNFMSHHLLFHHFYLFTYSIQTKQTFIDLYARSLYLKF